MGKTNDPASDASRMLEAALQQMDGIISGVASRNSSSSTTTATATGATTNGSSDMTATTTNGGTVQYPHVTATGILSAAQALSNFIQQAGGGGMTPAPDPITAGIINTWLDTHLPRQDTDDRLRRLQGDKDSLVLQVQVLSEQVAAQGDKISELERGMTEKQQLLNNADDLLRREMLSRSSLETQKLELMSAMSELKLQQAALERENLELRSNHLNNNLVNGHNGSTGSIIRRPPMAPTRLTSTTSSSSASTPSPNINGSGGNGHPLGGSHGNLQQPLGSSITPKTPPSSFRRQIDVQYNSLPRQSFPTLVQSVQNGSGDLDGSLSQQTTPKQRTVAFAETEKVIEDNIDLPPRSYTPQPSPSPSMSAKNKGLRGIFGKIKRSNSGNLEDLSGDGEFRRGGIRATAGARLGWSGGGGVGQKPNRPFDEWDIDSICNWLDEMGLGGYEEEARKWLKKGAVDLVKASPVDIEKELKLSCPLHRKKIVLALADITDNETDELFKAACRLDTAWIMRWLDDVGLPQHKDTFAAARVDGRMLHKLTMDDLAQLHVTSCLHASSLRRGIQVLREYNFDEDCLIRRSGGESLTGPFKVQLWTAHRVMEWLRVVDLAEYAPNLRGAGVHGALMMYEPKFNAELLADLLSIPPSKTLLRRHLATHFKDLLGRDIIQGKRDVESVLGYQPLTLVAKLKTPKKSQFSLKRKKSAKGDHEWTDFVCPMGPSGDHLTSNSSASNNNATTTTSPAMAMAQSHELEAVSLLNNGSGTSSGNTNNHQHNQLTTATGNSASSSTDNNNNASPTSSTRSSNS